MAKISEITRAIRANSGPVIVRRQGHREVMRGVLHDGTPPKNPQSLAGHAITIEGEWHHASVSNTALGAMVKDETKAKIDLSSKIALDADQSANPGVAYLTIDEDMTWTEDIPVNADSIPVLTLYFHDTIGDSTEVSILNIAWRRGRASDGSEV